MSRKECKKHRILSRIIAMVIIQGLIFSGLPGAYCGELLCQNPDTLSPHINISNVAVKDTFDSLSFDEGITRRRFLEYTGAAVLSNFLVPYLFPKSGVAQAGKISPEELDKINLLPGKRRELIGAYIDQEGLSRKQALENVKILFEDPRYKPLRDAYKKIEKIINEETDMPEHIIYALMLAESDLRGIVKSTADAYGPLQVTEGTANGYNKEFAELKAKGGRAEKYKIAVKLIGEDHINWKKMEDKNKQAKIEYSFRVGVAVAYLKHYRMKQLFGDQGTFYDENNKRWELKGHGKGVMEFVYLSTVGLNAFYNAAWRRLLPAIEELGPAPVITDEIIAKGAPFYDEHQSKQRGGWLEGKRRREDGTYYWAYPSETLIHFIRLWRYHHAIEEYLESKKSNQVETKKSFLQERIDKKSKYMAEEAEKKKIESRRKMERDTLIKERKALEEKLKAIKKEVQEKEFDQAMEIIREKVKEQEQQKKQLEKRIKEIRESVNAMDEFHRTIKEIKKSVMGGVGGLISVKGLQKRFNSRQNVIIEQAI